MIKRKTYRENASLIKAFLNEFDERTVFAGKTPRSTMFFDAMTLYSYGIEHQIARRNENGSLWVNTDYASTATSRQTRLLLAEARKRGLVIVQTSKENQPSWGAV